MILIAAAEGDPNVARVAQNLRAMNQDVEFLDHLAPSTIDLSVQSSGGDNFRICGHDISDIELVWYRTKLSCDAFPKTEEAASQHQREMSWRDAIQNFLFLLGDRVVNSINSVRRAEYKLFQLQMAREVGFSIPATLVSNDYSSLRRWVHGQGDVILKALGSPEIPDPTAENGSSTIMTTRISHELVDTSEDEVRVAPSFLQAEIAKSYEMRIIAHGDRIFAFKIESQNDEFTKVDWRYGSTLDCFSRIDLDSNVQQMVKSYMAAMGLFAGHFDLIRTPSGGHVFLECNPQGWFSWLDDISGGDVSGSIAEELVKRARDRH